MAKRVFLSFVYEDLNLVNLFRGQAKGPVVDLEFEDYSIKDPFNSSNADYIKRGIRAQLNRVSLTLCLYGVSTHKSSWVEWELNETLKQGKPIMGVYLHNDGRIKYHPGPLEGHPKMAWDIDKIVKTMQRLTA